jgi:hypothetical protein
MPTYILLCCVHSAMAQQCPALVVMPLLLRRQGNSSLLQLLTLLHLLHLVLLPAPMVPTGQRLPLRAVTDTKRCFPNSAAGFQTVASRMCCYCKALAWLQSEAPSACVLHMVGPGAACMLLTQWTCGSCNMSGDVARIHAVQLNATAHRCVALKGTSIRHCGTPWNPVCTLDPVCTCCSALTPPV